MTEKLFYILLYLNYLIEATKRKIFSPYLVAAVASVILGSVIALPAIVGDIGVRGTTNDTVNPRLINTEAAIFPLNVYQFLDSFETDGDDLPYVLKIEDNWLDTDMDCEFCTKIDYSPYTLGKAGFALKSFTPLDLDGAQRVTISAKGQYGGEQVRFMVLGKQIDTKPAVSGENLFSYVDFAAKSEIITLSSSWKLYYIDLPEGILNLNDITHMIAAEINSGEERLPLTIYVKGLYVDDKGYWTDAQPRAIKPELVDEEILT